MKRVAFVVVVLTVCCLFGNVVYADAVTVNAGTLIVVKTVQDIVPASAKAGDRVLMVIDKDVFVEGKVAFQAGASVLAEVSDSKEAGMAGQSGRISLSFRTVSAVDGQQVGVSGSSRREGGDKMVESIGLGLVCCPLFLLMKGEEGVIKSGQLIDVFTIQQIQIQAK